MDEVVLFENYVWNVRSQIGIKMKVGKNELVDFLNELKKEHKGLLDNQ